MTMDAVDITDRARVLEVARQCGQYIWQRNPSLRMLAISGSLTREDHRGNHDDADYFAIADKGHVWEAFLGCIWHSWRFSRRLGLSRKFFCFNYIIDEAYPEEIDLSRPEYVRELLLLEVLAAGLLDRQAADPRELQVGFDRPGGNAADVLAGDPASLGGANSTLHIRRVGEVLKEALHGGERHP